MGTYDSEKWPSVIKGDPESYGFGPHAPFGKDLEI